MNGYDVDVTLAGSKVMTWHGPAASRGHAEAYAKAAFGIAMRAAALGAGQDSPGECACEAQIAQSHSGAMTEHWILTSWSGGKDSRARLPDRADAAFGVAVSASDFPLHYVSAHDITAAVDLIARPDKRIVVKADLSAITQSGLAYLARRRDGVRTVLLALGVAHLAAGAEPIDEVEHSNANLDAFIRNLNDEPSDLLPGHARIAGTLSATLRASALPGHKGRAKAGLSALQAFAKSIGEKGVARTLGNRIKAL